MTIADMNAHLASGEVGGVYLFYGPEDYFKDYYISRLKDMVVSNDTLNYVKFSSKVAQKDLINQCDAIPMFGERKIVLVCESGYFTPKETDETLPAYLAQLPAHTCLIFREATVDKRSRLYKAIEKNGVIFPCVRQTSGMICKLLAKAARAAHRDITKDAAELLVLGIGDDLVRLLSELDKLILFTKDGDVITEAHVRDVCTLSVSSRVFDLTDAISENNKEKAFVYLKSLLDAKEPPQLLLIMIARVFQQLYDAKLLMQEGSAYGDIAAAVGVKDFIARKLCTQAKRFSAETLSTKLNYCVAMDESIKSGKINDVRALELIIGC